MEKFLAAAASVDFADVTTPESVLKVVDGLVARCAEKKAQLLLLPEYLTTLLENLPHYSDWLKNEFSQTLKNHAQKNNLWIVAGTHLWPTKSDAHVNRGLIFTPQGNLHFQDKICLIPSEKIQTPKTIGGNQVSVFDLGHGRKMAVLVCYDSEFPEIARHIALNYGLDLLLVPSWTSTMAGYWRVRLCTQARTIENQCFAMQAPLVGAAESQPGVLERANGCAGIFSPSDIGFPEDGVIALGQKNVTDVVFAELDFGRLESVRKRGQVSTLADARVLNVNSLKFSGVF